MGSSKKRRKKWDPMPATQVTIWRPNLKVAIDFATDQSGAERKVLGRVARAAYRQEPIPPELQKISNLILAKALLLGKLPDKSAGRPRNTTDHLKHVERAYRYYEELDNSTPEAAEKVGAETPVGPRQIQLEAQNYRDLIGGKDPVARARHRAWRAEVGEEEYRETIQREIQQRDFPLEVNTDPSTETQLAIVNELLAGIQRDLLLSIKRQLEARPFDSTGEIDDTDDPFF